MSRADQSQAGIELEGVSFRYPGEERAAVEDVNLRVPMGGSLGIVGESGSGKSTVARLMVGALLPDVGEARAMGVAWNRDAQRGPARRRVQLIFQNPYSALDPRQRSAAAVEEAVRVVQGVSRAKAQREATDLLGEVGLTPEQGEMLPRRLSGGQRQRVVIARALACDPAVIVADEPTSALDVSVQAQVINLLLRLRQERNLTLVMVSHNLAVVGHVSDAVAVMRRGRVEEYGPTRQVFEAPQEAYTRRLLAASSVHRVLGQIS